MRIEHLSPPCRAPGNLLGGLFLGMLLSGCSDSAAMSAKPPTPSASLPVGLASSAEFGVLVSGSGRKERLVRVRNQSQEVVQISRWTTSCECLSIEPRRLTLAPHETLLVRLWYDTDKEPAFVGDLLVSVEAFENGKRVAEWSVPVSLIAPAAITHLEHPGEGANGP